MREIKVGFAILLTIHVNQFLMITRQGCFCAKNCLDSEKMYPIAIFCVFSHFRHAHNQPVWEGNLFHFFSLRKCFFYFSLLKQGYRTVKTAHCAVCFAFLCFWFVSKPSFSHYASENSLRPQRLKKHVPVKAWVQDDPKNHRMPWMTRIEN